VAALVATNGKLQKNAAHAEGEHHLAASLLETFNARLVALKLANDKTSAEVASMERLPGQVLHVVLYLFVVRI